MWEVMADIRAVTTPRAKRRTILSSIARFEKRPAQARADLSHVKARIALFRRPFDPLEIASAVDDADDLRAMGGHAMQRQPALNDQRPRLDGDLRARGAKLGMPREPPTRFFDTIKNVIHRGLRNLPGDMEPDVEQVPARAARVTTSLTAWRRDARALPVSGRQSRRRPHRRCRRPPAKIGGERRAAAILRIIASPLAALRDDGIGGRGREIERDKSRRWR